MTDPMDELTQEEFSDFLTERLNKIDELTTALVAGIAALPGMPHPLAVQGHFIRSKNRFLMMFAQARAHHHLVDEVPA